ncbi:hypothetical protein OROGR_022967 [Orobanche gracilis]
MPPEPREVVELVCSVLHSYYLVHNTPEVGWSGHMVGRADSRLRFHNINENPAQKRTAEVQVNPLYSGQIRALAVVDGFVGLPTTSIRDISRSHFTIQGCQATLQVRNHEGYILLYEVKMKFILSLNQNDWANLAIPALFVRTYPYVDHFANPKRWLRGLGVTANGTEMIYFFAPDIYCIFHSMQFSIQFLFWIIRKQPLTGVRNSKAILTSMKNPESALVIYEAPDKRRRDETHKNPRLDDDFVESGDEAPKRKKQPLEMTRDKENEEVNAKSKGKAPMFNEEDISEDNERAEEIPNYVENKGNKEEVEDDASIEEDAEDESFKSLPSRYNLITFTKTLAKLDEMQVNAIDEMGFQAVRDLNIHTIPSRLAYWVVENFNHNSYELLLTGNRRILVTEDDVTRVYGFLKGKRFVQRFHKKDESQLFDEMMDYIPDTQRHKITIKKLHEVVSCVDGGAWFKRLFMVAIQSTFMESTANGYVSPYVLNCLSDVNRIKEWNWSEYVMRSLIENKTAYSEENVSHFVGPLLFLMFCSMSIEPALKTLREFPIIVNWTTKLLRSREKAEIKGGCFGDGLPQEPIEIGIAPATHDNEFDCLTIPKSSQATENAGAGVNIEVLSTTKKITELAAVHMMKLIETAPVDVVNTLSFHHTIDTAMKSISCSTVLSTQPGSHAKMPSFSLGLTQLWNSSPNEDFGIGGSSAGKNMQDGKNDGAKNDIVDVRTNTPTLAVAAQNVVANENVDLQGAGDTTAGFTNAGAEKTAKGNYIAKDLTPEERKDSFFENFTSERNSNRHLELREIEIFIGRTNTLQYRLSAPKYGDLVPNLRAILAEYLFYRGLVTKAKLLKISTLEIPAIKWGETI